MAVDDLYLENIDEFVKDESQVVTYKWLSRTLKVHVNRAKQMLYSYSQQQLKKQNNITITYLISGYQKVEGTLVLKVAIVKGDDLDIWKARFDPVTSLHIYSIQKSKLKNSNALYIADFDKQKEFITQINRYSAINCPEAIPRTDNESIKSKSEEPYKISSIPEPKKQHVPVKNESQGKPKSGGIASLFAAQGSKKKEISVKKEDSDSWEVEEKSGNCTSKGKSEWITSDKKLPLHKHNSPSEKSNRKINEEKHLNKSKALVFSSESEEEDPLPKKKRKRIKSYYSSSEEESVPPLSVSPHHSDDNRENELKQQSPEEHEPSPHHKPRKLVPKIFMEDDFMVTEKVWKSEPEKPIPSPPRLNAKSNFMNTKPNKVKKPSKKRIHSPNRNKQASLTAFFKKLN